MDANLPLALPELEKKLDYIFMNRSLIEEACRHSSYVNELSAPTYDDVRDNERLEFLGDAVLSLCVGHLLMRHYPAMSEGNLSRMRAYLVNENQLAEIAKKLNLGEFLLLGKGEIQTQGREKKSILADAFEALLAAVYLDGGFEAAFRFVEKRFAKLIATVEAPKETYDYKSKLQERVQLHHKSPPTYEVIDETGPDHDKTFTVRIHLHGACQHFEAVGVGKSKKSAEQDAARLALETLRNRSDDAMDGATGDGPEA